MTRGSRTKRTKRAKAGAGDWLAHVTVGLKADVLDPQGKTVRGALQSLGFRTVTDVRVGKHFWVSLSGRLSREAAAREATRMAEKVLVNPVIETFGVSLARRG